MGCCEIIPNQSVHWAVTHEDPKNGKEIARFRTFDPIPPGEIGKGKGHDNRFRVTLRFAAGQKDNAVQQLRNAATQLENATQPDLKTGLYSVSVDVVARETTEENTKPNPGNPYAQICVVW